MENNNMSEMLNVLGDRMAEMVSRSLVSVNTDAISKLLEDVSLHLSDHIMDAYFSDMEHAIQVVQNSMGDLTNKIASSVVISADIGNVLSSQIASALKSASPYLQESQRQECEEILPTLEKHDKCLSRGDLLTILGILISLFFGIMSSIPNKQLDRIIQQNETIIEQQQAEITEISKEDKQLRQTIDDLSETIGELTEYLDNSNDVND